MLAEHFGMGDHPAGIGLKPVGVAGRTHIHPDFQDGLTDLANLVG